MTLKPQTHKNCQIQTFHYNRFSTLLDIPKTSDGMPTDITDNLSSTLILPASAQIQASTVTPTTPEAVKFLGVPLTVDYIHAMHCLPLLNNLHQVRRIGHQLINNSKKSRIDSQYNNPHCYVLVADISSAPLSFEKKLTNCVQIFS